MAPAHAASQRGEIRWVRMVANSHLSHCGKYIYVDSTRVDFRGIPTSLLLYRRRPSRLVRRRQFFLVGRFAVMSSSIETLVNREYQYGFVTDVDTDTIPPGLSEEVVRLISAKKGEPAWLLDWRLKGYRRWLTM